MFTHVKSTIRHIAPDNLRGRSLIKVVYVVLESQYQSALSQAVRTINANNPNLAIEISGYLIEELRDPENYEEFKREIESANIFIASLIFIEDLAQKVVAAVEPHRDRLDVSVVFPSMPEVMRLSKMGSFSLAQLGSVKKCDRSIHAETQRKIRCRIPRWDAEAFANPAASAEVFTYGQGTGCPKFHAQFSVLARWFSRKSGKLLTDAS
ncbi:magnesium chelatase [Nostoc sp. DSM 114160]|jgi:cobalamin biosynthesis Mg chelatase CobN